MSRVLRALRCVGMAAGCASVAVPAAGAQGARPSALTPAPPQGTPPTAPAAQRALPTILTGVFTAEQADRGKELYLPLCQSCHVAVAHTGPVFRGHWAGRPLSDLYTFVSTRMPKNEPASLPPESYADLLAYILLLNQAPVGRTELVPDPAAMQLVRIQFPPPPKRAKR